MTYQPSFDLGMLSVPGELEADDSCAVYEFLFGVLRRLAKTGGPFPELEVIAMPMQNRRGFEICQHRCAAWLGELQPAIANFDASGRSNFGAKRLRHQLCAQTDT